MENIMSDPNSIDALLKQVGRLAPKAKALDGTERQVWQRINALEPHKHKNWPQEAMSVFFPVLPRVAFATLAIAVGVFSAQLTSGGIYNSSSSMRALKLEAFSIRYAAPLYAPQQSEEG
jgi:hypothetical protein